ncbi:MAG: hypothetical protein GX942_04225 [Papillibacter sp.]|nr:hypothetical protein [Papillibacter sp.]
MSKYDFLIQSFYKGEIRCSALNNDSYSATRRRGCRKNSELVCKGLTPLKSL